MLLVGFGLKIMSRANIDNMNLAEFPDGQFSITIVRRQASNCTEDKESGISFEAWRAWVEQDSSMRFVAQRMGVNPQTGEVVVFPKKEALASWKGHPDESLQGESRLFSYESKDGSIFVNNGDKHVLEKAHEIAAALNADISISKRYDDC